MRLDSQEMKFLCDAVRDARFFSLPAGMHGGEDGPGFGITITMNGITHTFQTGNGESDQDKWNRVYKVFDAIVKKIPSPYDAYPDEIYMPVSEFNPALSSQQVTTSRDSIRRRGYIPSEPKIAQLMEYVVHPACPLTPEARRKHGRPNRLRLPAFVSPLAGCTI